MRTQKNVRHRLTRHVAIALMAGWVIGGAPIGASAATLNVDNTVGCSDVSGTPYCTIQAAIDAAVGGVDTVAVAAGGTYVENLILAKSLVLSGGQAGVAACGRSATESTVAPGAGIILELQAGAAGSIIDGFTFSGATRGIESSSGPLNDLQLLNNRIVGTTSSAVFLNDAGTDITVSQNLIDGTSKTAGGGLFHLDQDNFDGFELTDNCIQNDQAGTGLFVDGNHNIGQSVARSPLISGNLFDGSLVGANLGRFAFEFGTISDNTFSNHDFDGLQGGIQNSSITGNSFDLNGRYGLRLTGFGGSGDATRGAQSNTITNNCFTNNTTAGVNFDAGQFPGTILTNTLNDNNITGNGDGVLYNGTESPIDAEDNWWGCGSGPGTGTCDSVGGTGSANVDTDPFATAPAPAAPCGCTSDPQCDDGALCNGIETCNVGTGACEAGTPLVCSGQCLTGACVEPTGCEPEPDGTSCDTALDTCSELDSCTSGSCVNDGGGGDPDTDGLCSLDDNCPADANPGQADADSDGLGDICDPSDGPEMNLNRVVLKRENKAGRTNGGIVLKGDFVADPPSSLETTPQITITIEDALGFSHVQTFDLASECKVKPGKTVKCKSLDRRARVLFKTFRKTPEVRQFRARYSKQAIDSGEVFAGPVTVTVTYGPPPPALGSIDIAGSIMDCEAIVRGLKCKE